MCLAVPGKVLEIVEGVPSTARVDVAGVRRNVDIGLLKGDDEPAPGDYVLVHLGCALARIDEGEAIETLRLLEDLGQAATEEVDQPDESAVS